MLSSFQYNGIPFSFVESDDFAHDFFTHADADPGRSIIDSIRSAIRTSVTLSRHHIIDPYTQASLISVIDRATLSSTFRRAVYFSRCAPSHGSVTITPLERVRWGTYRIYDSRITPTHPPAGEYNSFWDTNTSMVNILPAPTYSTHPDVWFFWERSVIHELVHALTGAQDPEVLDPRQYLGATETIAQRILSDINNPSYARTVYDDAGYRSLRGIRNTASQTDAQHRSSRSPEEYHQRYHDFQINDAHLPDWDHLPQWHDAPLSQNFPSLTDARGRLVLEHTTFPSTSLHIPITDEGLNFVLNLRTQAPNATGVLQEANIEITYTSDYELDNAIVADHHPDARIPFGIQITSQAVTRLVDSEDPPTATPPGVYVLRRGYWVLQPQTQATPPDEDTPPSPGPKPPPPTPPKPRGHRVFPRLKPRPSSQKALLRQHNINTIHRTTSIAFDPDRLKPDHLINRGGSLGMVMNSSTDYTFWTHTPYTNMAHFEHDFDQLFQHGKAARFDDQDGNMMAIALPHKSSKISRGYLFFTAREVDDLDNDGQKLVKLLMPLGRLDTKADHSGLEYRFYQHHPDGSGFWALPEDDWHIATALKATDHNILSTTQLISAANLCIINSRSEANAQHIALRFFNQKVTNDTLSEDAKADYEAKINYAIRLPDGNVSIYITPIYDANYTPYYYESDKNTYGYIMVCLSGREVSDNNVRMIFCSALASYNRALNTIHYKYGYKVYKLDPVFRDYYLFQGHPSEDTTPFAGFTTSEMFEEVLIPNQNDNTVPYIINLRASENYTLSVDNLLDLDYWNYADWSAFYNSFTWWSHISSTAQSYMTDKTGYLFADGSSVVAYEVKDTYYQAHTDTLLDQRGLLFIDLYGRVIAKADYNRNNVAVRKVTDSDETEGSKSNGVLFSVKTGNSSRSVAPYDNDLYDAVTDTTLKSSEHIYFNSRRYNDFNIYSVSVVWNLLQRDKVGFDLFADHQQPLLKDISKNVLALILHRMMHKVTTHVKYHEEL